MDTVDIICDLVEECLWGDDGHYNELTEEEVKALACKICDELGICEKCGAKLKGERNE